MVRHTLSNPQLKGYKYLIASCFNQMVTPAQDITYDKDLFTPNMMKPLQLYDFVRQVCVKVKSLLGVTYKIKNDFIFFVTDIRATWRSELIHSPSDAQE